MEPLPDTTFGGAAMDAAVVDLVGPDERVLHATVSRIAQVHAVAAHRASHFLYRTLFPFTCFSDLILALVRHCSVTHCHPFMLWLDSIRGVATHRRLGRCG